jgi:uncharacterized protein
VTDLGDRLAIVAAVVVGSVARGDFNLWSDTDVVLVVDGALPSRAIDRLELADTGRHPGIQPALYSPDEFRAALRRRNPLAVEATTIGVVLKGVERLADLAS